MILYANEIKFIFPDVIENLSHQRCVFIFQRSARSKGDNMTCIFYVNGIKFIFPGVIDSISHQRCVFMF